jgi:hypothetical protein
VPIVEHLDARLREAFHPENPMKSQEPQRDEEKGRVVQFRPRAPRARNDNLRRTDLRSSPVDDLGKYERGTEHDNYRHRMVNNLLAFAVLCLIVYCGIWLANTMAQLRKDQDCALTGRTNCAPIKIPVEAR